MRALQIIGYAMSGLGLWIYLYGIPFQLTGELPGRIDLYGIKLGTKAPESLECDTEDRQTCSIWPSWCKTSEEMVQNEQSFMPCKISVPANESTYGQSITVCVSDLSRRIGKVIVSLNPEKDGQDITRPVLEKLNNRLRGKGKVNYNPASDVGFDYAFEYSSKGESILAHNSFSGFTIWLESDAANEMLFEEREQYLRNRSIANKEDAKRESKNINLGL